MAAIGVAVGAGLWWPSLVATAIVVVTLLAVVPIERWLRTKRSDASIATANYLSEESQSPNALSSVEAANLAAELSSVLARHQLRVELMQAERSYDGSQNQLKNSSHEKTYE